MKGTEPFPDSGGPPRTFVGGVRAAVTVAIVTVPFAGLGVAVWLAWGHGLRLADVLLAGDPHSPYRYGTSLPGQLRGLAHAHVGWLLRDDPTPAARYARTWQPTRRCG